MEAKTVRLEGGDGRWLELTVKNDRAVARVGEAEAFPFSFEHLGYVVRGMGYQAWGSGGHLAIRRAAGGYVVEFQGPDDRTAATCRLSEERLRETIDALDALAPAEATRARML